MLQRVTHLAIAAPRWVIAIAVIVTIGAAVFGIPVAKSLSTGGFRDPTSDSTRASELLAEKFNQADMQLLIVVSGDGGALDGAVQAVGTDIVTKLRGSPYIEGVESPWGAPPSEAAELISKDGKSALIVAGVKGGEADAGKHAQALTDDFVHDRDGVTVRAGGSAAVNAQIDVQTQKDLMLMESIALPLSFLVLLWVFKGVIAAALPVAVGVVAILGSMAVLRAITLFADVSIFALNLTVAMGLALAIDYMLLLLSRYREERADGVALEPALLRTMATAGRTVLFSALVVALSMVPLALFPMYFLKSFAYAGVAVVVFAASAALVVAPAAIVLLGDRLDSLDVRRLARRLLRRPDPDPVPIDETFWYRGTKAIMRRAVPVGLAGVALLLVLGSPFYGVRWGFIDDRVLPASAAAHEVGDALRTDFGTDSATNVTVVIPDAVDVDAAEMARYAADLSKVPDVSRVSSPVGTFISGTLAGPPSAPTAQADNSAFITVASRAPLFSGQSEAQLDGLHAVAGPKGRPVLLTGTAQINRDIVSAITARLPIVLISIGLIAFVLVFLLTGSVVLPLKTVILNILSLTAAFGALVWIFQDGHLGALGTTATGTLVITMPLLLFCIAFGLSMDYQVFLVSRIREYWLASDRTRSDNDECVALGLAHTGRVITAAALIMSISFAAMIAAKVTFMRMFGIGLTVAVLMDATLVRVVLVPAFMHLLGRLNWWAPRPLARLYDRIGLRDSDGVGRHVASAGPVETAPRQPATPDGRPATSLSS